MTPRAWDIGHTEESVDAFPHDVFGDMASHGLFRVPFAEAVGGRGPIGAFATIEPNASTDLSVKAMETAAEQDGEHFVISGHKRWITNAPVGKDIIG